MENNIAMHVSICETVWTSSYVLFSLLFFFLFEEKNKTTQTHKKRNKKLYYGILSEFTQNNLHFMQSLCATELSTQTAFLKLFISFIVRFRWDACVSCWLFTVRLSILGGCDGLCATWELCKTNNILCVCVHWTKEKLF